MFSDPAFFNPYGLEHFSFFLRDGSPAEGKGFAPEIIVDSDGDGMPDFWEDFFGLDRWNAGDANGDYDLDGKPNLEEYLAGTDPTDAGSIFEIMDIVWDSGSGVPTIEWSSVPGMFYAVLSHTGPLGGSMSWVAKIEDIGPTEGTTSSWTDTGLGGTSEKYYSVEVYGR